MTPIAVKCINKLKNYYLIKSCIHTHACTLPPFTLNGCSLSLCLSAKMLCKISSENMILLFTVPMLTAEVVVSFGKYLHYM